MLNSGKRRGQVTAGLPSEVGKKCFWPLAPVENKASNPDQKQLYITYLISRNNGPFSCTASILSSIARFANCQQF